MGKIVLFLYEIPNTRILPFLLYKNPGFAICIRIKIVINNKILTINGLFLIKAGFIGDILYYY